ncbi:hypothetical protein ACX0G9_00115 [Flavitalea flava]
MPEHTTIVPDNKVQPAAAATAATMIIHSGNLQNRIMRMPDVSSKDPVALPRQMSTPGVSFLQRKCSLIQAHNPESEKIKDNDRDGVIDGGTKEPQKGLDPDPKKEGEKGGAKAEKKVEKTAIPEEKGPCGRKSQANGYVAGDKYPSGKAIDVELKSDEYGNTSKLAAFYTIGACKVKENWQFFLDTMTVTIGSRVQPIDYRINVASANDAVVTKTSYPDIVADLLPNQKGRMKVVVGGVKSFDHVSTSSNRSKYWNQQFSIDHETFHRTNWDSMYRPELINAEKQIWAITLPVKEAATEKEAIAKARTSIDAIMIDAYKRTVSAYSPQQESRAYNAGAHQYQELVEAILARAKKEGWLSGATKAPSAPPATPATPAVPGK